MIGEDQDLRSCLTRINATAFLFQIVIDNEGRIIGTVTDGDIRRALLDGANLNSSIRRSMNPRPIVARSIDQAVTLLATVDSHPAGWVPVVDAAGRPGPVVIDNGGEPSGIAAALVMAGGFGRRLGNLTRSTPKPLLKLRGKPILEHILRRLAAEGIQEIYVSTHYLSEQVSEFANSLQISASIRILEEQEPLGTAGALGMLPADFDRSLLVLNGDIVTTVDYAAMADMHRQMNNRITVGAAQYDFDVPYGVLQHDSDGRLTGITEKPTYRHYVAAGIYLLEPEAIRLVRRHEAIDMPALIKRASQEALTIGMFALHEYWIDVGQPDDVATAENQHREWDVR